MSRFQNKTCVIPVHEIPLSTVRPDDVNESQPCEFDVRRMYDRLHARYLDEVAKPYWKDDYGYTGVLSVYVMSTADSALGETSENERHQQHIGTGTSIWDGNMRDNELLFRAKFNKGDILNGLIGYCKLLESLRDVDAIRSFGFFHEADGTTYVWVRGFNADQRWLRLAIATTCSASPYHFIDADSLTRKAGESSGFNWHLHDDPVEVYLFHEEAVDDAGACEISPAEFARFRRAVLKQLRVIHRRCDAPLLFSGSSGENLALAKAIGDLAAMGLVTLYDVQIAEGHCVVEDPREDEGDSEDDSENGQDEPDATDGADAGDTGADGVDNDFVDETEDEACVRRWAKYYLRCFAYTELVSAIVLPHYDHAAEDRAFWESRDFYLNHHATLTSYRFDSSPPEIEDQHEWNILYDNCLDTQEECQWLYQGMRSGYLTAEKLQSVLDSFPPGWQAWLHPTQQTIPASSPAHQLLLFPTWPDLDQPTDSASVHDDAVGVLSGDPARNYNRDNRGQTQAPSIEQEAQCSATDALELSGI